MWPKNTCTTKSGGERSGVASATTTTRSGSKNGTLSSCCCTCLAKILMKVKKHISKEMVVRSRRSRRGSFQCRYDPLSYSLNFDRSGCERAVDYQDYYHFYAFSSRFVANPTSTSRPTQNLPPPVSASASASHHTHST